MTGLTAHAREAVREDSAAQIRGQLALDVARHPETIAASTAGLYLECATLTSSAFVRCGELPATTSIAPHGYYLIASTGFVGSSCGSVNPDADQIVNMVLTEDDGAVRLMSADGVVIDRVAWGANPGGAGGALTPWPPAGWSYFFNSVERKASATSTASSMGPSGAEELAGNGYDSGDNSADFVYRSGRAPQNTMSATEP